MSAIVRVPRAATIACLLVFALALSAHVGSPDTIWEGRAGNYPVRVIIRDPGVIPGLAEIVIRSSAPGIQGVAVTAAVWNADGGAPPPDQATRVAGDSSLWSAHVWFMSATSYGVKIQVSGSNGDGVAVVPFVARATRVTPLPVWLGAVLSALGFLLIAGMATIVTAAMRESTTTPGVEPARAVRERAILGGVFTIALLAVVLWLANKWWAGEAAAYAAGVVAAQPFSSVARVAVHDGKGTLTITITDSSWRESERRTASGVRRGLWSPLIPDHGKLMHAFLVADHDGGFAHVHPVPIDSTGFAVQLPPLPPGGYVIFADIVHESGWSQTLTARFGIPPGITTWQPSDTDDAWIDAKVTADSVATMDGGLRMVRENSDTPIVSGADVTLQFRVLNPDGTVATVEPYLGMAGHLALVKGMGVFIHLHPAGTTSMAATDVLRARLNVTGDAGSHQMNAAAMPGELGFPYLFPEAGSYRMWVQVRQGGKIRTAGFRVVVKDR